MEKVIEELTNEYLGIHSQEKIEAVVDYAFMHLSYLTNRLDLEKTDLTTLDKKWIKYASKEILERSEETLGIIFYSELGYTVRYDSSNFSKSLKNLLFPHVKT